MRLTFNCKNITENKRKPDNQARSNKNSPKPVKISDWHRENKLITDFPFYLI